MKSIAAIFVVSWVTGQTYQATPCVGKEPADIVCAKLVDQRKEQTLTTQESANDFAKVLGENGAKGVMISERKK